MDTRALLSSQESLLAKGQSRQLGVRVAQPVKRQGSRRAASCSQVCSSCGVQLVRRWPTGTGGAPLEGLAEVCRDVYSSRLGCVQIRWICTFDACSKPYVGLPALHCMYASTMVKMAAQAALPGCLAIAQAAASSRETACGSPERGMHRCGPRAALPL